MVAIAVLGIGLLAVSEVWVSIDRRQKVAELDWRGAQLEQAIGSYYNATPTGAKSYPRSLQDLIEDRRYPDLRRHLREIYRNPFTSAADWELVLSHDGGIQGVRATVPDSLSNSTAEYLFQP